MLKDKQHIDDVLQRFTKHVITQSKANLTRKRKNVTKGLYDSLKSNYKVMPNSISVEFLMDEYGEYQDKGVKGKKSSFKAPNSPFKFGSGTGKKGGLTKGIFSWVNHRHLQFRDKEGKFLSYKSTAFLITRSIYNKGLKPSLFFTKPFQSAFKNLPDDLIEGFGLDIEQQFLNTIKQP